MNYKEKYYKYKLKYQALKNQLGGSDINKLVELLSIENLHMIPNTVLQELSNIIPSDKFINPEQVKSLIETIGLDKIIELVGLYYMYQKPNPYYNVLNIYENQNTFFSNLYHVVLATRNIWIHLSKYIKSNTHTVLLIPGDSPTYFLFLLEILYPEIRSNPKVTIVQFPISGLGSISENIIEFNYDEEGAQTDYKINVDGKPYLKFIIDNNIPETVRQNPHQFVIIDYVEAGKSAVFIEHTIKELYETASYRLDENFVQVINLAYYFLPANDIIEYLCEFKSLKKKLEKKNKKEPNYFLGLDGVKRFEKFLFANWYLYLNPKFLNGLNNFATSYSINVLKYLVDESDRRCQYKLKLKEATELSSSSLSMEEFLSKIPKPSSIHLHCNLFNLILYLISGHLEQLNKKTGELFGRITGKIQSLIPINTPIKLVVGQEQIPWTFSSSKFSTQCDIRPGKTIGILDITRIECTECTK